MKSIIPGMIAGNTVVMKPAHQNPDSSKLVEKIFIESGFDNHEFQVTFTSHDETSDIIIPDERVKAIIFTGGTKAGRHIGKVAGYHLKKTLLELGGSDPFIVLEDANLDKVYIKIFIYLL
jgi:succinate-semialdehyde dehydrogenase/glutarate-semialdehyde dehydrogenase